MIRQLRTFQVDQSRCWDESRWRMIDVLTYPFEHPFRMFFAAPDRTGHVRRYSSPNKYTEQRTSSDSKGLSTPLHRRDPRGDWKPPSAKAENESPLPPGTPLNHNTGRLLAPTVRCGPFHGNTVNILFCTMMRRQAFSHDTQGFKTSV